MRLIALALVLMGQPSPTSINWYLHFQCEGCTSVVQHFSGGVSIEAPASERILHWSFYRDHTQRSLSIGEVFVTMSQTIHRITLKPSGVDIWVSPYGIAFKELRPAPKWHGQEAAPVDWAADYAAWLDEHDFVAENAPAALEGMRYKTQVHTHVKITQKQAGLLAVDRRSE